MLKLWNKVSIKTFRNKKSRRIIKISLERFWISDEINLRKQWNDESDNPKQKK